MRGAAAGGAANGAAVIIGATCRRQHTMMLSSWLGRDGSHRVRRGPDFVPVLPQSSAAGWQTGHDSLILSESIVSILHQRFGHQVQLVTVVLEQLLPQSRNSCQ